VRTSLRLSLVLTGSLLFAACSRQKTVTREDLRSDLVSSVSFAAEAETFIDHVRDGKSTSAFAQGHVEYIAKEVGRMAQELQESVPEPRTAGASQTARTQIDRLRTELNLLAANIDDKDAIAVSKDRIETIRKSLAEAVSSL